MIRKLLRPTVFAVALSMMSAGMASAEIRGLEILVPAAPGSGSDQTARAMSEALQQDDLASRIQITNIPGAGGTIGLAQFVTSKKGKGNAVMVTFYVMIGAIAANKPPVTLDDVTPLARLSGEYKTPLKELTRSRKFQQPALASLWKSIGKSFLRKRMAGHMALMPRAVTRYRRDVPTLAINRCPRNLAIRREVWWVRPPDHPWVPCRTAWPGGRGCGSQ